MKLLKKALISEKLLLSGVFFVGILSFGLIVYADSVSTEVIVGNATPVVSSTTLNSGSAITLTENTTTVIATTATVTDTNGCSEITDVTADFYRTTVGETSCDTNAEDDNNSCYARVACTVSGGTCTGGADTTADYDCSVSLQYYADATDTGSHSATNWTVSVYAADGTATSTSDTAAVELNTLLSLDVTSSIDYGTLSASADTGASNSTTTVTNTGNADMDPELSGTNLVSGGDSILVGKQEYSAANFTYSSGTDLTGTPAGLNITLPQGTSGSVPVTDIVLWGLGVDGGQPAGSYSGTTTIGAATGI